MNDNDREPQMPTEIGNNHEEGTLTLPLPEATPDTEGPLEASTGELQIPTMAPIADIQGGEARDTDLDGADALPEPDPSVEAVARQVFGAGNAKPLVVNLHLASTGKPGHFLPTATVEIVPALRTSGLLAAMPAEEVKTLVTLLTFLSPNGDIKPTAYEIAEGLNIPEGKAREWLSRLAKFRWQSRPIVATLWRETGMDGYTLSHEFVSYRQAPTASSSPQPAYRTAGRDAVIAHSRAKYARPRAEVERQIAMMQGWPLPEEQNQPAGLAVPGGELSPVDYLRQRLLRLGVTAEQAELLLETFPLEEIEQQIAWLPYRGAKNPASYLVAAITGSYEEPGLLRMRREQQQMGGYVPKAESASNPPPPEIPPMFM